MIRNLYIIGNGLDLYHGLKTGYIDFRRWLKTYRHQFYNLLCNLYDTDDKWWYDFENHIADIDLEKYIKYLNSTPIEAINERLSLWGKNTINNKHKKLSQANVQFLVSTEIPCFVNNLITELRKYINEIDFNHITGCSLPFYKENSFYITFNYTETLENIYGIKGEQVFHIHGDINKWQDIILGHGKSLDDIRTSVYNNTELNDETLETIINVVGSIKKDVRRNINDNLSKFEALRNIENLIIIGFSFSKIDLPYIDYILKNLNSPLKNLIVSFHTETDKNNIREYFSDKSSIMKQDITLIRL